MRKYRPSGRVPFLGFILLILLALVGAAAVGGLLWALDNYLNLSLVFVFPLLAGAIVGGLLALGVRAGKVRSPFFAALVGLVAGILIYGVYQGALYYVSFRGEIRELYAEDSIALTDAELTEAIDSGLRAETGESGILGYLRFIAAQGFSITRTGSTSTSSEIRVEGDWVYVYMVVEVLIAALTAAYLAARAARNPFDEEAKVWYGPPMLIGSAPNKMNKQLDAALKAGDFGTVGSLLSAQDVPYPRTDILIRRSPVESVPPQDIYVMVNNAQRANRTSTRKTGVVVPHELSLLRGSEGRTPSQRFDMQQTLQRQPLQPSEKFRMD
jgi:hypothetical protein